MKKLISGLCIALSMTFLTACSTTVTEENFLDQYNASVEAYTNASSSKTSTSVDVTTEGQTSNYVVDYSKIKNGEDYSAYATLHSESAENPLVLDLYYKEGNLYGSRSDDGSKLKYAATYEEFEKSFASPFYLAITDENIVSKEITKNEAGETVAKLVLKSDAYADFYSVNVQQFETEPTCSDITYTITYDNKGDVKTIDIAYDLTVQLSLAAILGDAAGEPQAITKNIHEVTTIEQLKGVDITFPEDLDSYIDPTAAPAAEIPADASTTAPATDAPATDAPATQN